MASLASMNAQQLCEWQQRMSYTNAKAANALGVSDSVYDQMRQGVHRTTGRKRHLDRRTALACVALEVMYVRTVRTEDDRGLELADACRPILAELINATSSGALWPLVNIEALVRSEFTAARTLCDYLDVHGDKLMPRAIDILLTMVAREARNRVLDDIENTRGDK